MIEKPDSPPECKNKDACRLHDYGWSTTCMGWTPVYDGHGNRVNSDPNTSHGTTSCSACGGLWSVTTKAGATTYETDSPSEGNSK